jgi:hypothetical protein
LPPDSLKPDKQETNFLRSVRKESQVEPSNYLMTTAAEATDKDFERMMQMLTGFFVTQIAGAVATYSIADHLAKGPATAEQISTIEGIDPSAAYRLLRACASLGLVTSDGLEFKRDSAIRYAAGERARVAA